MSVDFENYKQNKVLSDIFTEHPSLKEAFQNDATVYAWLQQYLHDRCTLEDAWIGIIVHLVQEKKKLFDEVIDLHSKVAAPKKMYVNMSKREIDRLKERGEVQLKKPVYEDSDEKST